MRFALVALSAVSLAAVTGCSSSPAPVADGAWVVNFDPGTVTAGVTPCRYGANFTEMLGQVNDSIEEATVTNGEAVTGDNNETATLSCTVSGTSTFNVSATAATLDKTLTVNIPSITPGATEANPAMGTAQFASAHYTTGTPYEGNCAFYFKPKTPESVASGKIWAAFSCPSVVDNGGGETDTCAITESFFVFETCGM